jgi:hypothetical protein
MATSVSGTKTCTVSPSPSLSAAMLTTLLATAVEDLKVRELRTINDALCRTIGASDPEATIGSCLG